MANGQTQPQVNFTAEDIQNLITAAIAAAKEPSELEKITIEEKRAEQEVRRVQIQQEQQTRAETARQQIQIIENKRAGQKICTHKHKKGETHCVFITDDLGGYIICQKCQAIIRPGVEPAKNNVGAIYDTVLFNQLFQDCSSNGLWG
jgi:hypothetical protein